MCRINYSKMFNILLVFNMYLFETVEAYISQYKWNQDLMQNLIDDYEIVYPFQVRDRSRIGIDTKIYYYTNASIHYDRATFVVKSSYGRFKIHVELNQLLVSTRATYKHILNETSKITFKGNTLENCFYQGIVHGEENSKAALSTCNGLQGVFTVHNQTYFIIPMKGGDLGKRHPHVFIRAKWHQKINCANSGIAEWNHQLERKQTFLKRQNKRDVASETKYVELAVVVDYDTFMQMDTDFNGLIGFIAEVVNGIDLLFKDSFKTRVSLTYLESWGYRNHNLLPMNDDITQMLLNFIEYSSKYLYSEPKDLSILISSTKFLRHEVTMAASGNVCNGKSAGIVQLLNRFESFRLSVVMSHNIAHILGVRHDDIVKSSETAISVCECSDKTGCLMSRSLGGRRNRFLNDFSSCSVSDFNTILGSGQGNCLFNKPLEEDSRRLCGNKIVDPGELCDCGTIEECNSIDPCCDAVTCTLKKGAECGAGPCCDNCKFITNNKTCRSAEDDCDVPEFCTGKSGQCPDDGHILDGSVCGQFSDGYCYLGRCQTAMKQCQALWGSEADVADLECFEKLNVAAMETGVVKTAENAMCSFLQCKGGSEIAKLPIYSKTEFAEHGRSFECKTASSGNKTVAENDGMVKDGTKCGSNKICIDGSCFHLSSLSVEANCPSNHEALHCSGHGVCTNLNLCYCNDGWTGNDCSVRSETQKPMLFSTTVGHMMTTEGNLRKFVNVYGTNVSFSTTTQTDDLFGSPIVFSRLDTYAMLIILGGVAGGVLMLLLFLALCYRRRTTSIFQKKKLMVMNGHSDFERGSESSMDTAHRSIRFGEMPSYRDEKVQSKRKKRSLHQIKESDEKDNISNKSKESARSLSSTAAAAAAAAETEAMLLACLQQNDLSRYPERGILKNGPIRVNSELENCINGVTGGLLDNNHRLAAAKCPPSDGYESEPAYPTFRVFETSMRKLNECDPYRRRSNNANGGGNGNEPPDAPYVTYAGSVASAPVSRRGVFCAYVDPPVVSSSRSGYCTDDDAGTTPCSPLLKHTSNKMRLQQAQQQQQHNHHRRYVDSSPETATSQQSPSLCNMGKCSASSQRGSPTTPTTNDALCDLSRDLIEARPLKLKNIEYLLKRLDRKSDVSLSPSASSTELSAPEADKDPADDPTLEESSNTESHRDTHYALRRDFPCDYLVATSGCDQQQQQQQQSQRLRVAACESECGGEVLPPSPAVLNRLNFLHYSSSQSNICSSCQLPTPDRCCGDGRVSSDGSCDNNVCSCKSIGK